MVTQYKAISIQPQANSYCNSVIFLSLLTQLDDTEKFAAHFTQIFGEAVLMTQYTRLQVDLSAYQRSGGFPASLPQLIQHHFLPKLATHLREHGRSFLPDSLIEHIEPSAEKIELGGVDAIAQQALAHLLQIQIQVYTKSTKYLSLNATIGESESILTLLTEHDRYQPLVNIEQLSEPQKHALQSTPVLIFQSTTKGLHTKESFIEEVLNSLVQQTMKALPEQLVAISAKIPEEPVFQPMLATAELSLMRMDYPSPDLPLRDLTSTIELPALHTGYRSIVPLFEEEPVTSVTSWVASMALTLVAGAAGGALDLGCAAGIAEMATFALGGIIGEGVAAVAVAGLPVVAISTLLTLIAGAVGKSYAHPYKQALKDANQYIRENNHAAAIAVLDTEFNRVLIQRALRSPFLTKADYAVAHFFRGMCAEILKRPGSIHVDIKKAYQEYQQALADANGTKAQIVVLLLHMKLIQLLRTHSEILLLPQEKPEVLIKQHLKALDRYFNQSLTHFYWQARKNIAGVALLCHTQMQFTPTQLAWIKGVLNIQSLFMLDEYRAGRGSYLQVFHTFFQALTIAYFHFNNQQALAELGLNPSDENEGALYVLNKLVETSLQFNAFRTAYPALAQQPEFKQCHEMMRHFALEFGGLSLLREKFRINPSVYQDLLTKLTSSLGVQVQSLYAIASKHDCAITFLIRIKEEFGLHFKSIEDWLQSLNDPQQSSYTLVSPRTQNNMLHMLAQLPEEMASSANVKLLAKRMQSMIHARNHEHHTPLSLLALQDAYGIQTEFLGPELIPLGTALNEVDMFVESVEKDVSSEGHLLLLEGPPGTGKTQTVLTYLRSKGHVIFEWEGGAEADKYVGQLKRRVIEFFKRGVSSASKKSRAVILFIDEMSGVCPEIKGQPENGYHDQAAIVDEFQKQISALKGQNVILVGATNYPERLSRAIQDRMRRVIFPVPDLEMRKKLLTHLLQFKCISEELIMQLVGLTQGWSPRRLVSMVNEIKEKSVSKTYLDAVFDKSRKMTQSDFKTEFKCAHLRLPRFEKHAADSILTPDDKVAEAFVELGQSIAHPELYRELRMHTLLYGPPGSGKTTAIREFSKQSNCPFILVESGASLADMISIFERAKTYTSVIICIDEIDRVTKDGDPKKEFLQEQMDGLIANNIVVVGATNFPERIAAPLMSRFAVKIAIPLPTSEQRGLFIQRKINGHLAKAPHIQLEAEFQSAMTQGCVEFGRLSEGLSYRDLTNTFGRFFARLATQQLTPSVLSRKDIIDCIHSALEMTQLAVVAKAQEMATPRVNFARFFREAAHTPLDACPEARIQFEKQ